MAIRICVVLCFVTAISLTTAAQDEPVLASANIPRHPSLACTARIEGSVKLTFSLKANAYEPTNIKAISGNPSLKSAAEENVKTWRFQNSYPTERKLETTFDYRLPLSGPQKVTFESFHRVEVSTCLPSFVQP